jgi:hypothetical protein
MKLRNYMQRNWLENNRYETQELHAWTWHQTKISHVIIIYFN